MRFADVFRVVHVGHVRRHGVVHGGRYAAVRSLRHADVLGFVRLGNVYGRRRVHAGSDAGVWQLRNADVHRGVYVGNVHGAGRVCPRSYACGLVRSVFAAGVQLVVPVGRVLAAYGQQLRVPGRREQSFVLGVRVRTTVVSLDLPLEHRVYVVLLDVRRLPVATGWDSDRPHPPLPRAPLPPTPPVTRVRQASSKEGLEG